MGNSSADRAGHVSEMPDPADPTKPTTAGDAKPSDLTVAADPAPDRVRASASPSKAASTTVSPTGPVARVLRGFYVEVVLRGLRAMLAPATVVGAAHVERLAGPAVFAANHTSHVDTMTVLLALPRARRHRIIIAAAADYWFSNRVLAAWSTVFVGAIPVERDRVNRRTLEVCHDLLGREWSLLVYPEGGRSPAGTIQDFKPGAAWIARRAGVAVVPVRIVGTSDVMPKGRRLPRRARVQVIFGEPMSVQKGEDARSFNDRIEAAVRALATPSGT